MTRILKSLACIPFLMAGCLSAEERFPQPLPAESIPQVETLPERYPDSWIFAHDSNFFSLIDGKVVVIDVASENSHYKGMIGAGQFASFLPATTRPELYVAETFYSRRTRGERTDVITIYDKASLAPTGEIVLPGNKRGLVVTQKASFRFTDGERMGLIFNFTPAASVTVVDLPGRKILNEIPIPGCSLIYPTGRRGFSTLCGNGSLMTFLLDESGKPKASSSSDAFNDIDADPLFMKTAEAKGVTYFPSFQGQIQPIDFRGDRANIKAAWSAVTPQEKAAGWRPGGWQIISADSHGRLYLLMQEGGREGSHKDGGHEVWVLDPKSKSRVKRLKLANHGVSIEATSGDEPLLVVVNSDMALDVYDIESGKLLRTIGGRLAETPFVLHAVQ